ncbi:MAG: beta-propeller domain-containing protein [Myxococcaceae bacterium]|nr:beta-propeller domain-containing protein [Myxococcaceae bacterium]
MRTTSWRRWLMTAGAVGAVSGCGDKVPTPEPVQNRVALSGFTGPNACTDLEQYLEDTAVLQMRTQLEAMRDEVPQWGWWGGGLFGRGAPELAAAGDARANSAAPPQAAPTNYTTTNNQVAGVDEADFVKNDGTRIFALSGNRLYAAKSWPAAELAVRGSLAIEGYPREMFLEGTDRVVVFSSIYSWYPLSHAAGDRCDSLDCGYHSSNTVKITVVDVSDLSNLRVTHEYSLPGHYNSARKVGSSVRLVLSDDFNFPASVKWWPEVQGVDLWSPFNKGRRTDEFNKLIAQNEKEIRAQTLAQWVPAGKVSVGGQTTTVPHECSAFQKVNAPTRLGTVSVVTLNLSNPTKLGRASIIAEPGEIYASQKNLYVATRHWWWWPAPGQRDTTYLHKFDISNPDAALYVASGTVDGHIVDQFSMDENQAGFFRVATTTMFRVPDTMNPGNWWGRMETVNHVNVLAEKSGALEVVGQSEPLAPGERVTSARFIEEKGFVVTFRDVDPLFTFDLSDPTNPKKLGELKIPGFSTYLHPMGPNHLLTIGTYVPEPVNGQQPDWRERALQLTIFDVTDMRNPKQAHTQLVGTSSGYSEAQHDHKAFNYFPAKKLLAIPFIDWNWSASGEDYWTYFKSDLRVFSVDAATGFTPKGSISMRDLFQVERYSNWTYWWSPQVRRSVMADDFVYAISDSGIRVANVANLSAPVSTARFSRYVER